MLVINNVYKHSSLPLAVSYRNAHLQWTSPQPLTIKNFTNLFRFSSFSLAANKRYLLMAIETEKPLGGMDLYVSKRISDTKWGTPKPLGRPVNSEYHEATPCLAADGRTLYFASNRPGGNGNMDLYVSRKQGQGWQSWSAPENLGPQVNTKADELGLSLPASGRTAYYYAWVHDSVQSEIFRYKLPEAHQPAPVHLLEGRVTSHLTQQPMAARITLRKMPTSKAIGWSMADTAQGRYQLVIPPDGHYEVQIKSPGYHAYDTLITSKNPEQYSVITNHVALEPKKDTATPLYSIKLKPESGDIAPDSFSRLEQTVGLYQQHSGMQIQLKGSRTLRVKKFLISAGVPGRAIHEAKGNGQPNRVQISIRK